MGLDDDTVSESGRPLLISRKLSRSRTSLAEEKSSTLEYPIVNLPQNYNPLFALNQLELLFNFVLKTSRNIPDPNLRKLNNSSDNIDMQMAVKQAVHQRRVRDMQVLGCIIIEIFAAPKCRILSHNASLEERYSQALGILLHHPDDIPRCVHHSLNVIFQTENIEGTLKNRTLPIKFDPITKDGLPPPSPHQLLQPLIDVILFPDYFSKLNIHIKDMREFSKLIQESELLVGDNKKKEEFIRTVTDLRVKSAAKLLIEIDLISIPEALELILPYILELFKCPLSSTSAAWYLTDRLSRALGPTKSNKYLTPPLMKLFESEVTSDRHFKLFHRSFLLQLIIGLKMSTFLQCFITPLIEGVGGYKEIQGKYKQSPDLMRKQSTTLK